MSVVLIHYLQEVGWQMSEQRVGLGMGVKRLDLRLLGFRLLGLRLQRTSSGNEQDKKVYFCLLLQACHLFLRKRTRTLGATARTLC